MSIIAADVGGTKTRLVHATGHRPGDVVAEQRLECSDFDSFDALLHAFLEQAGIAGDTVDRLTLALPAPVQQLDVRLTNLPWVLNRQAISKRFGIGEVDFINDFQAAALGVGQLAPSDCVTLVPGVHESGALRVVVGAGTGLGMAWLLEDGNGARAFATEGGHIDYAPTSEKEIELLRFLMQRFGHVSYERVLSGPGLVNVYECTSGGNEAGHDAAGIQRAADGQADDAAIEAMQLFVRIYGSYVGNMAMLYQPKAGIYIAGGVAAKIMPWMQSRHFIDAYGEKGRMSGLVREFPVRLVTNERLGALGALTFGDR